MDLATMRTILGRCLAGRTVTLDTSEIDRALNFVYQYQLPNRIDGSYRSGMASIDLIVDQDTYTYEEIDPLLRALEPGARFDNFIDPLDYYERERDFWDRYRFNESSGGRPSGYLPGDKAVIFRPTPTAVGTVVCPATFYWPPLTNDGLTDEEEAHAVVYGAAVHLAHQNNWDALIEKNNLMFKNSMDAIQRRSRARMRRSSGRLHGRAGAY